MKFYHHVIPKVLRQVQFKTWYIQEKYSSDSTFEIIDDQLYEIQPGKTESSSPPFVLSESLPYDYLAFQYIGLNRLLAIEKNADFVMLIHLATGEI